jgi:hypothetical protein
MGQCICGCGETTAGGTFLPGHDQRLRTETERRAGGLIPLAALVDAAETFARGKLSQEMFAERVRLVFRPGRPA